MGRQFVRPGWWAATALLAAAAGCSGPETEVGQVSGTVRIAGKPHHEIQVRFYPDGAAPMAMAEGLTDQAGRYTLYHCPAGGTDYRSGAVVGRYKVVLVDQSRPAPKDGGKMAPSVVPARYGNPTTTPLTFEVKPGDDVIDIEVK